jgi:hypothetical protein
MKVSGMYVGQDTGMILTFRLPCIKKLIETSVPKIDSHKTHIGKNMNLDPVRPIILTRIYIFIVLNIH